MLDLERLRAALIGWYRQHQRDLPWRRRRDAYAIWISEVMLQQTRVDTVIPYYERFLSTWPTVQALAAADPEAVRAAWSGLGYYRRARLMLEAAHRVVADHGGELPRTPEELLELPGFGRYTAGAVASIAHGARAAAVDGNVVRVLARLAAIEGDTTRGPPRQAVDALADRLAALPGEGGAGTPGEWTQALMELGATVCAPKAPRCGSCPLADACRARALDRVDAIPPPKKRAARSTVAMTALVTTTPDQAHVWLAQRPREGLFAELWTPVLAEGALDARAIRKLARELGASVPQHAGSVTHVLTHRDLEIEVWSATLSETTKLRRVALDALAEVGLPSIAVKLLQAGMPRAALARTRMPGRAKKAGAQLSFLGE